jgi:hypothetical protein
VVRAVSLPLSLLLRSAAAGGDFALKKTWGGSEPERLDGAIAVAPVVCRKAAATIFPCDRHMRARLINTAAFGGVNG